MINLLREQFTREEQEWYVGNLYMYMHYHATNDFVINLDHIFSMIGFATKGNAKRTLQNNFTKDEDYKILSIKNNIEKQLLRREKLGGSGILQEDILLNVDTFKNLKTEKGKMMRKYYVKLENIYNQLIKEEMEENRKQLNETAKINEELSKRNKLLEQRRPEVTYEEISKQGHVYIMSCDQVGTYKCGRTKNVSGRVKGLQTACLQTIQILFDYPTNNDILLENAVHHILDRYRCNSNREHFRCNLDYMKRIIGILGKVLDTLKSSYQTITEDELLQRLEINCVEENKNVLSYPDPYEKSFYKWLDENIIYSYGDVLQLNTICEAFIGNKVSPRSMSKFRKELERYIAHDVRLRDKKVHPQMQDSSYNGIKYKGYLHLALKE